LIHPHIIKAESGTY